MKLTFNYPGRKIKNEYSPYFVWFPKMIYYEDRMVLYWLTFLLRRPVKPGEDVLGFIGSNRKIVPMFYEKGFIYRELFWQELL